MGRLSWKAVSVLCSKKQRQYHDYSTHIEKYSY